MNDLETQGLHTQMNPMMSTFMMVPATPQAGGALPSNGAHQGGSETISFENLLAAQQPNQQAVEGAPKIDLDLAQKGLEALKELFGENVSVQEGVALGAEEKLVLGALAPQVPANTQVPTNTIAATPVFEAISQQLATNTPQVTNLPPAAQAALAEIGLALQITPEQGAVFNPQGLTKAPQASTDLLAQLNALQNNARQSTANQTQAPLDIKQLQQLVQSALQQASGTQGNNIAPTTLLAGQQAPLQAEAALPQIQLGTPAAQTVQNAISADLAAAQSHGQPQTAHQNMPATNGAAPAVAQAAAAIVAQQNKATPAPSLDIASLNLVEVQPGTNSAANIVQTGLNPSALNSANNATFAQPQLNAAHIGVQIAQHYLNGKSRFEIRIDPPEMGRVDVRMDVDRSGQVTARLAVERIETLEALQRDSRALERALQDAGLDMDSSNLSFSLKDQQEQRESLFEQFAQNQDELGEDVDDVASPPSTHNITQYRLQLSPGQIDMRV